MTRLSRRELATRIRGLFYPGTGEEVIGYILDRLRDKSKRRHFKHPERVRMGHY